jgi:hypothetical protein
MDIMDANNHTIGSANLTNVQDGSLVLLSWLPDPITATPTKDGTSVAFTNGANNKWTSNVKAIGGQAGCMAQPWQMNGVFRVSGVHKVFFALKEYS